MIEQETTMISLPKRKPDIITGVRSFWFDEMIEYDSHSMVRNSYKLRFNENTNKLQWLQPNKGEQWLDHDADATRAYIKWQNDVIEKILLKGENL